MSAKQRIGILLGSARAHGNGRSVEKWFQPCLERSSPQYDLVHVYPDAPMHPLGPLTDEVIPALVGSEGGYANPQVEQWSQLIKSCHALVIITPQYNWGYPGDLKTALDHLYHEWKGKPVLVITYGGHGGGKCAQQLKQVLEGLHMKVVEENVEITLPREVIQTAARLEFIGQAEEDWPSCLREAKPSLDRAIQQLRSLF